MGPSAVTLYAKWTPGTYVVSFDAQGGNVSPVSSTVTYGSTYGAGTEGSLPTPTKTGYNFAGWYTQINGGGSLIQDATTVATANNHTIYANWTQATYTVTFDANGGTGSVDPITQGYNTSVTLPTSGVTRAGYTFLGWNTTNNATTALSSYSMPANDSTLYAVWEFAAADYSAVNAAIALAQANNLPANAANDPGYRPGGDIYIALGWTHGGWFDKSQFTTASRSAMSNAINAVNWSLNSSQQATVDGYAAAITAAYNNLVLLGADYSALNAKISEASSINRDLYTAESLAALDSAKGDADAVAAMGLKLPAQEIADSATSGLTDAISNLVYVGADYSR